MVYGGLLGAFFLARFASRVDGRAARVGMVVGIGSVTIVWVTARAAVAWPWFVLLGTAITIVAGQLAARLRSAR